MGFIRAYIDRPQQLWIRKAMFQIHLWLGIGLGLYVIVIGVTGSILVFKEEAVASLVPRLRAPRDPAAPAIDVGTVTRRLAAAATPGDRVMLIAFPSESTPEYQAIAARFKPSPAKVMMSVDPATGDVLGQVDLTASWLGIVHGLHISLLSGPAGFIANGIGSILFLVITATGLFLWWPGIRSWVRAFTVDFRRTWTRVNFDLHNTIGFYTLLLVSFWGVSTVYFVWEDAFVSALSRVTAVTRHEPEPPPVSAPAANAPRADLNALVARAHAIAPELRVHAIMPGLAPKQPVIVFLTDPHTPQDPADMPMEATRVIFDPFSGAHLTTYAPPVNRTVGDWIVWSMVPLHFGNKWGLAIKIIWAVLGLSLPVLTVTGFLMYWNRYLSKAWRRLGHATHPARRPDIF